MQYITIIKYYIIPHRVFQEVNINGKAKLQLVTKDNFGVRYFYLNDKGNILYKDEVTLDKV